MVYEKERKGTTHIIVHRFQTTRMKEDNTVLFFPPARQLTDLLADPNAASQAPALKIEMRHAEGASRSAPPQAVRVEGAVEKRVSGSLEYAKAMKLALQHRAALANLSATTKDRAQHSHLYVSLLCRIIR